MTSDIHSEVERYSATYGTFLEEMRTDFDEFVETGTLERARELSKRTGQHFSHSDWAHYASFVLVHLNPKQAKDPMPRMEGAVSFRTFEEYFDAYRHFGARKYGQPGPPLHKSPFDHKQVRFLCPFSVIDFVEDHGARDPNRFLNLERAIDRKLQLELIPYGSASFSTRGFNPEILRPHYERIMDVIAARPRTYILFCGRVFDQLLDRFRVEPPHEFHLTKRNGTQERQRSRFVNLRLEHAGKPLHAGLASSWARQGLPMASYAEEIRERYQRT